MSVVDDIVAAARVRVRSLPAGEPEPRRDRPCFRDALAGRDRLSIVAEVKRRSPSEGELRAAVDPAARALGYQRAGASAISVLTEPDFFAGSLDDLADVTASVDVPVLMKDFVVDPEQVRVAALFGASAFLVLLRVADEALVDELVSAAEHYGLVPLLEAHDAGELERAVAVSGDVRAVVGVNNRDLGTLCVDRDRAAALAARVPADRVLIAESGYDAPDDLDAIRGAADAVLVGSALMRAAEPRSWIEEAVRCA